MFDPTMSSYVSRPQTLSMSSPLKVFGDAKNSITEIFIDFSSVLLESDIICKDYDVVGENLLGSEKLDLLTNFLTKTNGILEILKRNCMKVAFFGRTSNGKSTVINAMLKNKILPSGIGHTTNCFVQVEGSDSNDAYIITEDAPTEKRNVQSLSQLASALSKVKLTPDSLVRICWPKGKCRLLRDDVIFVDSPGIDVSPDMDKWIDKFCLDADVFVLVVNAESTLMQTEKNFFHRVSSRLSKPNIFILNNRWDASATEPETREEVKQQHLERNIAFLTQELRVMDSAEAAERVFFVSAIETLQMCANNDTPTRTPVRPLADGYQARLCEFGEFEKSFEECISQAAMKTKFAQHSVNGKVMVNELNAIWEETLMNALAKRSDRSKELIDMTSQVQFMDQQLGECTNDIISRIDVTVADLDAKMTVALHDEIRRISSILEEFERPFDPDPTALAFYKKELNFHVEECLSRNLHIRYSSFANSALTKTSQYMHDSMAFLLPESSQSLLEPYVPSRDFEMTYHLDCPGLCADFYEDIEFRFSLGITSLARRFLGSKGMKRLNGHTPVPRILQDMTSPQSSDASVNFLNAFTSVNSGATIGALAVITTVGKAVGWRFIAICGALYGTVYVFERITWTTKAKEDAFKRQYKEHVASRLKMVVNLLSRNCSQQVQQELTSIFSRLSYQVTLCKENLQEEVNRMERSMEKLDDITEKIKQFRLKSETVSVQIDKFVQQYLKQP